MINVETKQAYSEVNTILKLLGNVYSSKIPNGIKDVFTREMDKGYIPIIDINRPIKEQNLKRKTISIISALNLQYWCTNESEQHELKDVYYKNWETHQEKLREQYNPDNLFKNKKHTTRIIENKSTEQTSLINIEQVPLYKRILNKIMSIFHLN